MFIQISFKTGKKRGRGLINPSDTQLVFVFSQVGNNLHQNKKRRERIFNPNDIQGAAIFSWIVVPNRDR